VDGRTKRAAADPQPPAAHVKFPKAPKTVEVRP
jgi:hypothetical protein